MMRRMSVVLSVLMPLLASCTPATGDLTSVRLTMGYRPDVQFAPLYVAETNGYYEQAGLDVEFVHLPETEAVELVGANEIQFAIASGEQVLLARSQGLPIVYVMAWWQDNPVGVAAPADSGIQVPQDLVGKNIGLPGHYGASYIGLRALLHATDVSDQDMTLDPIGYTQVEALLAGREDAVVIYVNNEPVQLEALGMDVLVMRVADYVRLPGNGLITNETTLRQNPDLVRAMVEATLNGLRDTIEDPDAAFETCKLYVEGLVEADQEVQQQILTESIKLWVAERLGSSDPEAWANIQDVLLEMGLIDEELDVNQAFTNEYLP